MAANFSAPLTASAHVEADKVILAAAGSPLGIAALAMLVLGALAYGLFRGSGDRYKLVAFSLLLAGAGLLLAAVLRENQDKGRAASTTAPKGAPPPQANSGPVVPTPTDTEHAGAETEAAATPRSDRSPVPTPSRSPEPSRSSEGVTAWSNAVPAAEREGWDGVIFTCGTSARTLATTKALMRELHIDVVDVTPANRGGFDSNMVMYLTTRTAEGGKAFAAMLGARLGEEMNWSQVTANGARPDDVAKRLFIYLIAPGCRPSAAD
jgi:hypothetical protein